jgi:putative endonuclease
MKGLSMRRMLAAAKSMVGRGAIAQELVLFEKWWLSRPQRRWILQWRAWRMERYDPCVQGVPLKDEEKGFYGECLAAHELKRRRRKLLFRNYRAPHGGEVDIVCRHRQSLTFVEVKTRTSLAFGRPAEAVGKDKQKLIQRGAADWLKRLQFPPFQLRFDIVEVLLIPGELPELNVIEDAFQLPDSSLLGRTVRYE